MNKVKEYVWFCEIERFGYMLHSIGKTEDEARNAMIKEYIRVFKKENDGDDPKKTKYYNGRTYYDVFIEELFVDKREYGKVEWD